MSRLNLKSIADHIKPLSIDDPFADEGEPVEKISIHVGTAYDLDYMKNYTKIFPAVWVAGQESVRTSKETQNFSGLVNQKMRVSVPFRIVVNRYAEGLVDPEKLIDAIFDELVKSLFGWKPEKALETFEFDKTKDGPASDSLLVADNYFSTFVRYRKTLS